MGVAVEVRDVSKRFRLFQEKYTSLKERVIHAGKVPFDEFWALSHISLEVNEGETIGFLGHNGSGKSTLLKCIAGILQPSSGEISVRGRVASMLELGAGFHPELSGRANIFLNASLMGMSKKDVESRMDDIVEFSELGPFIENQVKYYSSGMYARLGFAVAINMDPEVLLVDEVLAVGDENFQRKCVDRIKAFQRDGRTIVFVSHSPELVRGICDRGYVLDHGRLVGEGSVSDALSILRDFQMAGSSLNHDPSAPVTLVADSGVEAPASGSEASARRVVLGEPVLQSDNSGSSGLIQADDFATVTVGYEVVDGRAIEVGIGLEIFDVKGDTIFHGESLTLGDEPLLLNGKGEILIRLGRLPLGEGVYSFAVSLLAAKGGELIDWKNVEGIKVLNARKSSGILSLPMTTLVNPDA
ncbi:MAG: polysaccharide ABC transporter ATP-binding protein [Acidimicrobiales bacterium]